MDMWIFGFFQMWQFEKGHTKDRRVHKKCHGNEISILKHTLKKIPDGSKHIAKTSFKIITEL